VQYSSVHDYTLPERLHESRRRLRNASSLRRDGENFLVLVARLSSPKPVHSLPGVSTCGPHFAQRLGFRSGRPHRRRRLSQMREAFSHRSRPFPCRALTLTRARRLRRALRDEGVPTQCALLSFKRSSTTAETPLVHLERAAYGESAPPPQPSQDQHVVPCGWGAPRNEHLCNLALQIGYTVRCTALGRSLIARCDAWQLSHQESITHFLVSCIYACMGLSDV